LNIEQIFQSLQKGKISPSKAKKLLSLYSIEKIGNIAQIDTGRKNRKGIPEIILGERKQLLDLKKIIKKTLSKNNEVLVSRIKKKDYLKKIFSFIFININSLYPNYYHPLHYLPVLFIGITSIIGIILSDKNSYQMNFLILFFIANVTIVSVFFIQPI